MNFTVSKTALLSRLNSVSKMIQAKSSLPILYNFLFDVQKNVINITSANEEGQVKTPVECISDDGCEIRVCIGATMLLTGLKALPEQPLIFKIEEPTFKITIEYQGGKFEMIGFDPSTFPSPKEEGFESGYLSMPANDFLSGINQVHNLAADDELRPTLASVYVDVLPGKVIFVAADGHALGTCERSIQSKVRSFMISKKMGSVIKTILPGADEVINIQVGSSHARIISQQYEINFRLVEGKFPNYNSVIPKDNDKEIRISTESILGAINRVSAFASKATSLIVLELSFNQIKVTACDTDYSTNAEEIIPCEYNSAFTRIGVKYSIAIDVLSHIKCERCVMTFKDPSRAMIVTPEDNNGEEKLMYLLMPMTINN